MFEIFAPFHHIVKQCSTLELITGISAKVSISGSTKFFLSQVHSTQVCDA